jgi:hypothetical protein
LVPSNDHLYGTETLFGDWAGKTLLLAKDGAPTPVIKAIRDKGEARPWRHAQRELGDSGGWKSNDRIVAASEGLAGGKLYGSATANLLYDDPAWSRSLRGFYKGPVHEYLVRVLAWVIGSMPNIRCIACLGQEAWFLSNIAIGQHAAARHFAEHRDLCRSTSGTCSGKTVLAFALYHPAARVSNESQQKPWDAMRKA